MNIFIVTLGSRGDVQPYVALAKGLQAAGHNVTVCTSASFESFIKDEGLHYGYMSDDFMQMMNSAEGRDAIENTGGVLGSIRTMKKLMQQSKVVNRRLMQDSWAAAQVADPDLVIYHPKALGGPHIAEKLGVPAVLTLPVPLIVPTGVYTAAGLPMLNFGRWYNRLSYALINRGYKMYDGLVNEFRQAVLGLGKMSNAALPLSMPDGQPIPVLHGVSPHIVPRPDDWPDHVYMNGYWFLDQAQDWQPSADLLNFLDAGNLPVYVGFGSMAGRNPQRLAGIVVEALQLAGARGIIAAGWGGLKASDLPDTIFSIDQAPHDWLFPRMAAVVHHGGAGTVAAGLRAGRPTVICPFIADQPFWGKRIQQLGAGSAPIPHKQLTPQNLAVAIREVMTTPAIRQNAESLGEKIRREDGIANAVAVIEGMAVRV
jgi:sterol 3beta-glucosyltransferase